MLLNCGVGGGSWRVPWTARRSNQSILKKIRPEYSLEGLMLKLKFQYFGTWCEKLDSLKKTPDAGKDWRQEEKGMTEDEMVGWHQQLNGHEFEQAPGVVDGQGNLACCIPWGRKESDTSEQLNWTELIYMSPNSWTSLPPPTPSHSSRLSQSTRFELPVSYSKFSRAISFSYGNVYISVLLSHSSVNCIFKLVY